MLACTHHVSWLTAAPGGKWICGNCKAVLAKKDLYPKFDELGPEFQSRWERHEKGEPLEVPMANREGSLTSA